MQARGANVMQYLVKTVLDSECSSNECRIWEIEVLIRIKGAPGGSAVKNSPASAGDSGSVPESGRSPEGGNGNPLQCSCLGNSMDRGAWRATVHGVTESDTAEHTHTHTHTHTSESRLSSYMSWIHDLLIRWYETSRKRLLSFLSLYHHTEDQKDSKDNWGSFYIIT